MKIIIFNIFLLISTSLLYQPVLAQRPSIVNNPSNTPSSNSQKPPVVLPDPPPGKPVGGRVRGGARRTDCKATEPPLTALVTFKQETKPGQNIPEVNVWGYTAQERPTLWFYLPYIKEQGLPVEFDLQDEDTNSIYKTAITLPEKPAVVGISLPANAPALQVGKKYRWFLAIGCKANSDPGTGIYVEGTIVRKNLDQAITKKLQAAQPKQQVSIYVENGIWHDAVTTLAQLRLKNPQDSALAQQWKELLEAIGLADIGTKPIFSASK